MTFKEFYWYSLKVEAEEERDWTRQSVMMSLHANMNAPKGKRYTPDDFNPFRKVKGEKVSSTEDAKALKERILSRNRARRENKQ